MKIYKTSKGSNSVAFKGDINCPKCNRIAKILDYFDKESIECPICGFNHITYKDIDKEEIFNGYGVLYAEFINKPFLYIVFDEPISENQKQKLLKIFDDYFLIKEKSYFYLYNPETETLTILKGNNPRTFDEYIEEEIDKENFRKSQYQSFNSSSDDYYPFE